jgi:hypothetical protein
MLALSSVLCTAFVASPAASHMSTVRSPVADFSMRAAPTGGYKRLSDKNVCGALALPPTMWHTDASGVILGGCTISTHYDALVRALFYRFG